MAKLQFDIWKLEAGSVRRQLLRGGWDFTEAKSLTGSTFVVRGSDEAIARLRRQLSRY